MSSIALPINNFHWPTNWQEVFPQSGPLHVEIGFGNAQYLVDMAQHLPSENFVGLEISSPSIRNGERKIANARLHNVRLIRATAQTALWLLFRPGTISTITINFPDPWPKASHHDRRLVSESFLQLAATRMKPGGKLNIATDHSGYAAWITDHLSRSDYFKSDQLYPYTTEDRDRKPTKYELKAIDAGYVCHYFKWSRNDTLSAVIFNIPEEYPMPHIVLQSPISLGEIIELFESKQFTEGTTKVRFINAYYAEKMKMAVIDTFIHEEFLEQRLLLSVALRQTGDYLVSVHEVGFPRSTRGVHLAVNWLGLWIEGLSERATIVRHNLQLAE